MCVFWGFNIGHVDKEIHYCTQQIESNIWKIQYLDWESLSWLRKNKLIDTYSIITVGDCPGNVFYMNNFD